MTERCSVNDADSVLDEGLGSHQLVVASVVDHVDDTGLPGDCLATPGEVTLKFIYVLLVITSVADTVLAKFQIQGSVARTIGDIQNIIK